MHSCLRSVCVYKGRSAVCLLTERLIYLHQATAISCFWSYLHDGVEGRVGADTEVGAGHVVTNGGRQHAHRDTKLLVVGTGLIQLQQRLEGLMVVAAIWC